ncbi:hypothetical protein PYCC9005_005321 [Savitreella phatthalungensis]
MNNIDLISQTSAGTSVRLLRKRRQLDAMVDDLQAMEERLRLIELKTSVTEKPTSNPRLPTKQRDPSYFLDPLDFSSIFSPTSSASAARGSYSIGRPTNSRVPGGPRSSHSPAVSNGQRKPSVAFVRAVEFPPPWSPLRPVRTPPQKQRTTQRSGLSGAFVAGRIDDARRHSIQVSDLTQGHPRVPSQRPPVAVQRPEDDKWSRRSSLPVSLAGSHARYIPSVSSPLASTCTRGNIPSTYAVKHRDDHYQNKSQQQALGISGKTFSSGDTSADAYDWRSSGISPHTEASNDVDARRRSPNRSGRDAQQRPSSDWGISTARPQLKTLPRQPGGATKSVTPRGKSMWKESMMTMFDRHVISRARRVLLGK